MQRALGATHAPNPELEDELQAEIARIEPKVERGTVTKVEADHLHSLEARAHGHTEKGGTTAKAQSVVAKRERALSLSDSTNESQAHVDSSHTAKGLPVAGAGPAADTAAKLATLALIENHVQESPAIAAASQVRFGSWPSKTYPQG